MRQSHKMLKHAQTIRRQEPRNCLGQFVHFIGLADNYKDTRITSMDHVLLHLLFALKNPFPYQEYLLCTSLFKQSKIPNFTYFKLKHWEFSLRIFFNSLKSIVPPHLFLTSPDFWNCEYPILLSLPSLVNLCKNHLFQLLNGWSGFAMFKGTVISRINQKRDCSALIVYSLFQIYFKK